VCELQAIHKDMYIYHIKHFVTCHTPSTEAIRFSYKHHHRYRM